MKAKDYVDQVHAQIKSAETSLNQAYEKAEKSENKSVIQNALSSLQTACDNLNKYKD
ncbi:hypothetical protein [Clostridium hydrogeniformans]|uniref:hypothetical protein n=1 Tax=Clostridium hydrogeniformans TaxID=349933 RepID=UPI000AEE6455|nr:hypothetical protein [Clostridium hydrogeniformans]